MHNNTNSTDISQLSTHWGGGRFVNESHKLLIQWKHSARQE